MSGYPGLEVIDRGLIDRDAPFIEKPFTADGLLCSVGGLLHPDRATERFHFPAEP